MKGYLTVFLALSLTVFLTVFLILIGGALQNLGRMQAECAADIGMNSLLAEFHRELLEQYDLFYIDLSYGGSISESGNECITGAKEHLAEYVEKNLAPGESRGNISTWNTPQLKNANITEYVIASDDQGEVLARQACAYMGESGREDAYAELSIRLTDYADCLSALNSIDGMALWGAVMEYLFQTELPKIQDQTGKWVEVPLDNPADAIYQTAFDQLEGLKNIGSSQAKSGVNLPDYLSHRTLNQGIGSKPYQQADSNPTLFKLYLFEKCGYFGNIKAKSRLHYQLEYIVFGKASDQENFSDTVEQIFRWRFADNIEFIFNDAGKYAEAVETARSLYAVQLKPQLEDVVARSILYGWAFEVSIEDTGTVLGGGQIPLQKNGAMSDALDYSQYLWLMLASPAENTVTVRAMDIMEMDIRLTAGNEYFRMDWCIDSFRGQIQVTDRFGSFYEIDRRYGYY